MSSVVVVTSACSACSRLAMRASVARASAYSVAVMRGLASQYSFSSSLAYLRATSSRPVQSDCSLTPALIPALLSRLPRQMASAAR